MRRSSDNRGSDRSWRAGAWHRTLTDRFCQLHPALVAFARSRVNCHDEAQDVVQDLYLEGPEIIPNDLIEGKEPEKLLRYCLGYIRKRAFNAWRREARTVSFDPNSETSDEGHQPWIEAKLEAESECARILVRLSPRDAWILKARYLDDKSFDEIREVTGSQPSTARVQVYRALRRARRLR